MTRQAEVSGPDSGFDTIATGPRVRSEFGRFGRPEFLRPGVLLETLEQRLAGLQRACRDIGEAVALQYFHSAPWVAWVDAGRHNGALVIEDGEI